MEQRTCQTPEGAGDAVRRRLHVAIIMDGNGRWAAARGRGRTEGHRAGARAVRRVVEAAPTLGIGTLTLYAFSSDNWKRPAAEVRALLRLLLVYLRGETAQCVERGVRVTTIGRRDRLPAVLRSAIASTEAATAGGTALHLRIALDYSARGAMAAAAAAWRSARPPTAAEFATLLGWEAHAGEASPDVDLLIRTGGEQRLSDFLLWECAYAELYFTRQAWPDFDGDALAAAVQEFAGRERRFGGLPSAAQPRAGSGAGVGRLIALPHRPLPGHESGRGRRSEWLERAAEPDADTTVVAFPSASRREP